MLYKVVLILSLRINFLSETIQMKATEQYFPVVLFIMLYKAVLTFESVDEILKCDHSNENYRTVVPLAKIIFVQSLSIYKSEDFTIRQNIPEILHLQLLSTHAEVLVLIHYPNNTKLQQRTVRSP